ncbi:MAG: MurR/RpiR family transcriptional regulator [Thermaerobacter sp.]|nr:MurR/RpiR family transcriptional regulator [Thermaerobacter sp.]
MANGVNVLDNLHQRIRAAAEISPLHQDIADYLAAHMRDASLMSAQELAQCIGVSQASISRFCTALGYAGYGDFVRTLQNIVREEWHAPERTVYLRPSLPPDADPLLAQEIDNLEHLPDILDDPGTRRMADAIVRARRIVLAGARISATLIPYAAYCLGKVRDQVEVATPGRPTWDAAGISLEAQDLVVAWVFPRYPKILIDWLGDLRQQGIPIAAFTDRWISPACDLADPSIVVPVASASLFDGYAGPMFLINCITRKVAEQTAGIHERLEKLEAQDLRRQAYWTRHPMKGEG